MSMKKIIAVVILIVLSACGASMIAKSLGWTNKPDMPVESIEIDVSHYVF